MITSLRLKDFKNFADETLRVGPFTLIVGANASGKSNIRDAFRFLHGVGRGYTVPEIVGGKFGPGGQIEWEGIRGAPLEITQRPDGMFMIAAEFSFKGIPSKYIMFCVMDALGDVNIMMFDEKLENSGTLIYRNSIENGWQANQELKTDYIEFEELLKFFSNNTAPALTAIERLGTFRHTASGASISAAIEEFSHMRFLDPVPDRMRQPSFPGQTVLGDRGENLPGVLQAICADPARKALLTEWLGALAPMDAVDLEFPLDPSGRVHLMLKEKDGRTVSAFSASDGTLRFLALLAAMFSEESKGLYFFEDIDSGVHPARLHLLLELIERRTKEGRIQVVATTHSPTMLTLMNDTTFENASVVCRLEHRRDAIIRRLADLPNVRELRETQGLGDLFETGWMEDMLHFTSDDEEEDDAEEAAQ